MSKKHSARRALIAIVLVLYVLSAVFLIHTDLRLRRQLEDSQAQIEALHTLAQSQANQLTKTREQLQNAHDYIKTRQWICPECGAINPR